TPSVGRATALCRGQVWQGRPISIHALRGEGDGFQILAVQLNQISIHALRGEGDEPGRFHNLSDTKFLSTPSVGRATQAAYRFSSLPTDFYPRPPWGGRRNEG